jgi:prepilin-type N-terminal cleavage/methylation domain-containing protein
MSIRARNRGFTLIELLVVIAIIGILSSVFLASLNSGRNKAKNARIQAELKQLKTKLDIYNLDHDGYGAYVFDCTSGAYDGNTAAQNVFNTPEAQGGVKEIIDALRSHAAPDTWYYGFTCATGPYWGSWWGQVAPDRWAIVVPKFGGGFYCYDSRRGYVNIQNQVAIWGGECP